MNRLVRRFEEALCAPGGFITTTPDGLVTLTDAGEEVLPFAREFVSAANALAPRAIAGRAQIVLSTYPAIAIRIAGKLAALLEEERLVLHQVGDATRKERGTGLVQQVAAGRVDIAVAPSRVNALGAFDVQEDLAFEWSLRVVLPRGHTLQHDASISLRSLIGQDLALLCSPSGHGSRDMFEEACQRLGLSAPVVMESSDQPLLRSLAGESRRLAAIIPEDMAGVSDAFGPVLTDGRRPLGGTYSVYQRVPRTARDRIVAAMTAEVLDALKGPPISTQARKPMSRRASPGSAC